MDIGRAALQGASAMALDAAAQVAEASLPPETPENLVQPARATSGPPVLAPDRVYADLLIDGLVNLRLAEVAYKAGAAIIRTDTEMQDELMRAV